MTTDSQAWALSSEKRASERLASERRAVVYQWLSGLFAQELSDEQFNFYQAGKADEWLSGLARIGLEREVKQVKVAIAQWLLQGIDPMDLRADFAGLFLLDGKVAAPPYASVYLDKDGQMFGEMESQMRYFLSQNQLQLQADFKEPADHLAVYLALMQQWIINTSLADADGDSVDWQNAASEQHKFLQQALMTWLPMFVKRCHRVNVINGFYPAVADLLLAFVKADGEYLQSTPLRR